jgi:ribosome-binding protein aMBF1 (putative translation factor)
MKISKTRKTSDALRILGRDDDAKLRRAIEEQVVRSRIAEMVLAAREARNLTQAALAKRMGTHQSVISRIEDADADGSVTVATLTRLFAVLDMDLSFEAVTKGRSTRQRSRPRRRRRARVGGGRSLLA